MSNQIPTPLILIFGLIMAITGCYNLLYLRKYKKLMLYFRQHYPNIYEQIRVKPDIGPLYSSRDHYKASIDYAKNHEPLDDPIAEALLSDYVKFAEQGQWILAIIVAIAAAIGLVWMTFFR